MADSKISTMGRFSSQMLSYLGAQRSSTGAIKYHIDDSPIYPRSTVPFENRGRVPGSYSPTTYNTTRCFFLSRGASDVYADTMSALAVDTASLMGIPVHEFLQLVEQSGRLTLTPEASQAINMLRDPGNQLDRVKSVNNRTSFQSRQIRA